MTEEEYCEAVQANPNDNDIRIKFAAWLENRGDKRGAYLRSEVALARSLPSSRFRFRLMTRVEETRHGIDKAWLRRISRPLIDKCEVSLKFRCPKLWTNLSPTDSDRVKFCDGCQRKVFLCEFVDEAIRHASAGHCIAADPRILRRVDFSIDPIEDSTTPVFDLGIPRISYDRRECRPVNDFLLDVENTFGIPSLDSLRQLDLVQQLSTTVGLLADHVLGEIRKKRSKSTGDPENVEREVWTAICDLVRRQTGHLPLANIARETMFSDFL